MAQSILGSMEMQYTVSEEEKKNIHNANADLHALLQRVEDAVHPNVVNEIRRIKDMLKKGLVGIWEQEEKQWHKEFDVQEKLQEENNFNSEWSISDVTNFNERPEELNDGFQRKLVYSLHFGAGPVSCMLPVNPTWLELWKAADELIKESGDNHHVFIESFDLKEDNTVELSTGS